MLKKQIIKKVFDEEFDIEKMRNQILSNIEREEKKYMIKFLRYSLPVCLMILICGVLVLNGNHLILKRNDTPIDNIVYVNEIDSIGMTSLDADIKEISTNGLFIPWLPWQEIPNGITAPKDLDKFDSYSIYTRGDKTSEYDILNCYVYSYSSTETNKSIRISFSDTNKPIRDYYFEKVGKTSKIKETELTIYQYDNTYFTEFKYKNYYFDIETNNISLYELTSLLESIIK